MVLGKLVNQLPFRTQSLVQIISIESLYAEEKQKTKSYL